MAGHLTRDPQMSFTPNQIAIVDFGLAVNHKYKDKDEVCFVDCVAFGGSADAISKYVKKGDPLLIEGRLAFDQWTAQDGSKRSKHKIVVDRFTFLSSRQQEQGSDTF